MKKTVRLTESDLVRLVKKVIKEQYSDDDFGFNSKSRDAEDRLIHQHGDDFLLLKGYSSKQVQRALSNLSKTVKFISFLNCENADFSNVDLCELPSLVTVYLRDTPNNLEETQENCFEIIMDGLYDFDVNRD